MWCYLNCQFGYVCDIGGFFVGQGYGGDVFLVVVVVDLGLGGYWIGYVGFVEDFQVRMLVCIVQLFDYGIVAGLWQVGIDYFDDYIDFFYVFCGFVVGGVYVIGELLDGYVEFFFDVYFVEGVILWFCFVNF